MQWHQSSNGFLLCVLEIQIPFFLASFSNKESSFPCLRPSVFKDFTKESEAKLNSNGKCELKRSRRVLCYKFFNAVSFILLVIM